MNSRWATLLTTMAIFLTACGAQPANLPTVTPIKATPTQIAQVSTPTATSAVKESTAVNANGSSTDRPYAKLPPDQRSHVGTAPPRMVIDTTKIYIATIQTSKGNIKVELDPSAAPNTVNNFVYLSQNGFYDGLTFHRVVANFVIQGGDPLGNGTGGPGYNIPPEIKLTHVDGAIAMARQSGAPETTPSSGSQFYITLGAQPSLDQQYTVFGKTIAGLDVVKQIAVGDVIQRIDITTADSTQVAAATEVVPTPSPEPPASCSPSLVNVVDGDHIRGQANAPVIIMEYGDMQCPACAQLHPALLSVFNQVSDTVQLVFRNYPLTSIHDKAQIASQAIEAANLQGKFWEMHDLLYEKSSEWTSQPVTSVLATLKGYATDLKLDAAQFEKDINSTAVKDRVDRDVKTAMELKLDSTPSMFINGQQIDPSAFVQPGMADQVRQFANKRKKVLAAVTGTIVDVAKPDQVIDIQSKYQMTITTNKGDILVDVDPSLAPVSANSIVFLAQKGYFNNAQVDQNVQDLGAILFGDTSRVGNPGYSCSIEKAPPGAFDKPGAVAVLNNGRANLAQIIVVYSATQQLNGQFSVIGYVSSGLELARSLQAYGESTTGDKIVSVTVNKK